MKVMLAIAPWDMWEKGQGDDIYPIGLAYLGAILEKNNHKVSILNLTYSNWDEEKANVIRKIKEEKPDIFGISILSNSRISALKLINLVKKIIPDIPIIAGGIHTTFMYEQILNYYPVDFTVLNEGEYTLIELIKAIEKRKTIKEFKKIKGIAFKNKDKIIKTEPRERIKDLNSLPIPKHELFKNVIDRTGVPYIMTSRGCPFSCSFCPSSAYWGRCMIQRNVDSIIKEIKYIKNKFLNLKHIAFVDDEFVCNNQRVIELCKRIIKEKIKIKWTCLGRASSMNEEVINWMKKAGCFRIFFGIESGSQRILNNIGKKVEISQIINALNLCKKYNIDTSCLTIVGLPGEDSKSVKETINLFKKLKIPTEPAILIVFPGTKVYELAKEKGLLNDNYWLKGGLCPLYTCEHPKWKLLWWSFKTGFITYYHSPNENSFDYLYNKILKKLIPYNFYRILRRYITNQT